MTGERRAGALAVALPAAIALLVYLNTLGAGFVYDDNLQIVANPWVQDLGALPRVVSSPVWAFRTDEPSPYWRPLQMGLYSLLWAAGGGHPLPFHLLNVLLHAGVTALLALLVLALTRDRAVAGAAALLFAVHPVHTEVVAWIASLPELLFSAGVLGGLVLHLRAREAGSGGRTRAAAAGAFAVALLSKETALAFLPLVVLLDLWTPPGGARGRLGRAGRGVVPYAAVAVAYLVLRGLVTGGASQEGQATLGDSILNAPWLFWSYVGTMLLPLRLVATHAIDPVTSALAPSFVAGTAAGVALVVGIVLLARRRPDLAFAGLLAVLPLLPPLYLPALRSSWLAERYTYLPSAGLVWLLAAGIAALVGAFRRSRAGTPATAVVVIAALLSVPAAARTVLRNRVWHDDEALALATIRDEPRADLMYVVLGNWYRDRGREEEALAVYERGVAAVPGSVPLVANRVSLSLKLRRLDPDAAVAALRGLGSGAGDLYELHVVIGDAYLGARRFAKAKEAYRTAIAMNPRDALVHNRLAVAHMMTGKLDRARASLLEALAIDPELEAARDNLRQLEEAASAGEPADGVPTEND